jgi:hypothetical protein
MAKGEPMTIDYTLKHGSHESPHDGLCAMEWGAYRRPGRGTKAWTFS